MFLLNLCPFRVRQADQTFAWIAVPALQRIPADDLALLGAPVQAAAPEAVEHGPWVHDLFGRLRPGASDGVRRFVPPQEMLTRINDSFETALDLEQAMVREGFQEYREWLFATLVPVAAQITAIITLTPDQSLQDVARALNLRMVRIDASPIRRPTYRFDSHALDLSGNGGSDEVERRYDRYRAARLPRIWASRTALCDAVLANPAPKPAEAPFEVGVALQDDAQMPGADQTWPAIRVLFKAAQVFPPGRVLIREHPAATMRLARAPDFGALDGSTNSAAFVARCNRLLTASSSVAFDAAILGVPAYVLGDSYLRLVSYQTFDRRVWAQMHVIPDMLLRLEFLASAFYVPAALFLVPAYLRFRLGGPDEGAIRASHLAAMAAS